MILDMNLVGMNHVLDHCEYFRQTFFVRSDLILVIFTF